MNDVFRAVSQRGDEALRSFARQFDGVDLESFRVPREAIARSQSTLQSERQAAILDATDSIRSFHALQIPRSVHVQTRPGVHCDLEWRPIRRVGLYVPGGSAPLVSTLLMLAIPATIAECPEIAVFTPPHRDGSVSAEILFAAHTLGVDSLYTLGGAQAVAAMTYGTESVSKVDKIFGPGNRFVTAAKALAAQPPTNVAIDMIAGPTELLIIADESSNANWIASDLLSQAEHGADSQVVLVTTSRSLARKVMTNIDEQLQSLPRSVIAKQALDSSMVVVVDDLDEAVDFSNAYAPEHLIIATRNAEDLRPRIVNAGSVFLGPLTSVVFGDYASGTNHTLPTAGSAAGAGGLTVSDFMKPIFFQTISSDGLESLVKTTAVLAEAEGLEGHARAARSRELTHD